MDWPALSPGPFHEDRVSSMDFPSGALGAQLPIQIRGAAVQAVVLQTVTGKLSRFRANTDGPNKVESTSWGILQG